MTDLKHALRRAQAAADVQVDGDWGPITEAAMKRLTKKETSTVDPMDRVWAWYRIGFDKYPDPAGHKYWAGEVRRLGVDEGYRHFRGYLLAKGRRNAVAKLDKVTPMLVAQ